MKIRAAYIFAIIIFLTYLACGIVIAAGIYTNGFESIKTLYAKTGGAVVKTAVIIKDEFTSFELKNAGFAADKWGDYTIEIASNPGADYTFEAGGKTYDFIDLDFSDVVLTRKVDGGFLLRSPGSLESALETKYKSEVTIEESDDTPPFIVTLTAESGKSMRFLLGFGKT